MPIEKRVILFSLQELHEGLQGLRTFRDLGISDLMLFDVARASQLAAFRDDRKTLFLEALTNSRAAYDDTSILFRFLSRKDHTSTAFGLSPDALQGILVEMCLKAKVVLPKISKRNILIQDLHVGLTLELNDTELELDLIPEKPAPAEKA